MGMGGVLGVLSSKIPRDALIDGVGGRKISLPYILRFEHGVKRVLGMSLEKKLSQRSMAYCYSHLSSTRVELLQSGGSSMHLLWRPTYLGLRAGVWGSYGGWSGWILYVLGLSLDRPRPLRLQVYIISLHTTLIKRGTFNHLLLSR
jgi:hypothetical protein